METAKKKKNDTISRKSFWQQHYPLITAILTAFVLFIYSKSMFALYNMEFSTVLYPHQGVGVFINFAVLHFVFPSISLFIFVVIFKRNISTNRTTVTRLSDFFTLILTCFICFATLICIIDLRLETDRYNHKDTLRINNHSYTLSFHDSSYYAEFSNRKFVLYHCENLAFFCSKIYETSRRYGRNYQNELAFDDETQAINIIIDGEVVHTHQLE